VLTIHGANRDGAIVREGADGRRRLRRTIGTLGVLTLLGALTVEASFRTANPVTTPTALLTRGETHKPVELVGFVAPGSLVRDGPWVEFALEDGDSASRVVIRYRGEVPDALASNRRAVVIGTLRRGLFLARPGSLRSSCDEGARDDHC
jgi:cytochrome c-type biogenesis protein CcmE